MICSEVDSSSSTGPALTIDSPALSDSIKHHAPARADLPLRGIGLIIAASICLGWSDALGKYLSPTLPSVEIAWIRFLVFFIILIPVVVRTRPNVFRSTRPGLQVWRGLGLVSSSLFFISGLGRLPIAEASATSFVAPLFVTALSILFLGESVGIRRWAATVAGLIGVIIVVRPGSSAFDPAVIFPIASALGWASTLVMTRMISGKDRVTTTMVISAVTGLAVLTLLVPFVWVAPSGRAIFLAICIGFASTAGQWIVVLAFRYADASALAPFSYSQLVWVTVLGVFVFGEVPDLWTIVGAAVIIGSGLYTAHRERLRRARLPLPVEPYPSA